jgi:hypothetical protein
MACSAQTTKAPLSLTSQDMAAAEWGYGYYLSAVQKTLYEEPVLAPDGAHGFLPSKIESRISVPQMMDEYCTVRMPVVAQATEQSVLLAESKKTVYTVTRFTIDKTLRSGAPVKPGGEITVVELGGAITDEHGVELRVGYLYDAPFAIGHTYLLFLSQAPVRHSKVYLPDRERTEIVDGHLISHGPAHVTGGFLYASRDNQTLAFKQGESFDEFWKMQLHLGHYPCYSYGSSVPTPLSGDYYRSLPLF